MAAKRRRYDTSGRFFLFLHLHTTCALPRPACARACGRQCPGAPCSRRFFPPPLRQRQAGGPQAAPLPRPPRGPPPSRRAVLRAERCDALLRRRLASHSRTHPALPHPPKPPTLARRRCSRCSRCRLSCTTRRYATVLRWWASASQARRGASAPSAAALTGRRFGRRAFFRGVPALFQGFATLPADGAFEAVDLGR